MNIKEKISIISKYSTLQLDTSNATEERNQNKFHVPLPVEDEINNKIEQGTQVIIMTGEAGEGKSHVINYLRSSYSDGQIPGYKITQDFSALSPDEKKALIYKLSLVADDKNSEKYIIAANIGIFVRSVLQINDSLLDKIMNPSYGRKFYRYNFETRNLAEHEESFHNFVKSFYQYDSLPCEDISCPHFDDCPFEKNLQSLLESTTIENIRYLCDAIFLMGGHITLREFLSLLASFATVGLDCCSIQDVDNIESIRFYHIFDKRDGVVLDKISRLDPANESSDEEYMVFMELNKNLAAFKQRKRKDYFSTPASYKKLPIPYLQEFKNFLLKISTSPYYFDVTESDKAFELLKKGFVKLVSPEQTNLQISFFDLPKPINKRIKTQFLIDFNDLDLIWHHPEWNTSYIDNNIELSSNINSFCLSVFYEKEESEENDGAFSKHITLKINFALYEQICRAKDSYFLPQAANTLSKYGLSEFFTKILRLKAEYSEKVNIVFESSDNFLNFSMKFYKKSKLLKKDSPKMVIIEKM